VSDMRRSTRGPRSSTPRPRNADLDRLAEAVPGAVPVAVVRLLALAVAAAALGMILPVFTQIVVDRVLGERDIGC